MAITSWTSSINLETPAGRLLRSFTQSLPAERLFQITVFRSAALQMQIEPNLLSADVDVFSREEDLAIFARAAGFEAGQANLYLQVSSELNFRTSPLWKDRTSTVKLENAALIFPHPIDILIGKLNRLDEKDVEAFRVTLRKTGHPTELELIGELQMAVDLFRPGFDEEQGRDMAQNCRRLWPLIYGRELDPRAEIIAPALAKRRAGYGEPERDYGQELRDALRTRPT